MVSFSSLFSLQWYRFVSCLNERLLLAYSDSPQDILRFVSTMATAASTTTPAPQNAVFPRSHVGFDSITQQIEKKLLKRGFQFNVMCVGMYPMAPCSADC